MSHGTKRIRLGLLTGAFLLALAPCSGARAQTAESPSNTFRNLRVTAHTVVTTHGLDHSLRMPSRFRVAPPEHRTDTFHGHPFRISLTAFLSHDAALMVHAESVADDSGASDYDTLPKAVLAGVVFHRRPDQCVDLRPADLRGEHDLQWLDRHGFAPTGPLQVRQYLASNARHDREIVLTFMVRVHDCARPRRNRPRLEALIGQLRIDGRAPHGPLPGTPGSP